ncbi:amino acid ABC transporter permease [Streptomyces silvisoli]|uniref:Amino acid ABC transporter permease n=1 Tax=Streptomyces silvisoli TaxID=3034235 RepID=A0ABT5ZR61_9ACTN|nr:amino acid ABC transporter permease [Streptomyces silvisoli]MDF3292319.1 amino acid ABC transporter permease [Streptomyces silvisoli]
MHVLLDDFALFRHGFVGTLLLTSVSAALSLALGVLVAACRVSPVPALRILATVWVTLLRNTPVTLLFLVAVFAAPRILFPGTSHFALAVGALGCYTSAFVGEALRHGVDSVPLGQAEAARSLGMTFPQTLRLVVLPQAGRTAVAPIGSLMVALTKNSAIAGSFDVTDLFAEQRRLSATGHDVLEVFVWIALAYLLITFVISELFQLLEHRLAVAR